MKYLILLALIACETTQQTKERQVVDRQQTIYQRGQPIPSFDFSLERARVIELYQARMKATQTWAVWRSMTGMIEGDCPSSGYPLPYGVQLTAPESDQPVVAGGVSHYSVLPQAEPNGLFTNGITSEATWVPCIVEGVIAPVYVETKVTVYPYLVTVDYETNRVLRSDVPTVTLTQ